MAEAGSPDTALVLRSGSDSEMMSVLMRDDPEIIEDAPGIARDANGPIASAELFVVVDLPKRDQGTSANVPLRGVEPAAFEVRDDLHIVAGRRFEPGKNEVIAGVGAAKSFAGLEVGKTLTFGQATWTVVGLFDSGGTIADSELWCDALVLQPAYHRGQSFQVVYAKLTSPAAFDQLKDALTSDPRLDVKVIRENDFLAERSATLQKVIRGLGFIVAFLMGIAAVFGALNTMYSSIAARSREIATLRALGFPAGPVIVSVMVESLVLALLGAVIGGAAAYFGFNGHHTSTLNWQTFSQVTFAFRVTPLLLVEGAGMAIVMGLVGGLFPGLRAASLPVATALREL